MASTSVRVLGSITVYGPPRTPAAPTGLPGWPQVVRRSSCGKRQPQKTRAGGRLSFGLEVPGSGEPTQTDMSCQRGHDRRPRRRHCPTRNVTGLPAETTTSEVGGVLLREATPVSY